MYFILIGCLLTNIKNNRIVYLSMKELVPSVFAQGAGDPVPVNPCPTGAFKTLCDIATATFGSTIGTIIGFIFVIAVLIAVFYLIYGGIKWIMSRGDKAQVEEARNHIVAAIVGLIVVFLAFFLINLVLQLFLGTTIQNLELPSLAK